MRIKMHINLKDFYTLDGLLSQIQQSSSKARLNSTGSESGLLSEAVSLA